jgi:prepilin-type N-terminal cleavage/methylation domain-containing protein
MAMGALANRQQAAAAPRPVRCTRAGFSLLELMIALSILAIALIPVAYFYSKSLQMVEEAGIRTRALELAQERITELEQMPYDQLYTNVTPSKSQLHMYGSTGAIDTANGDWFGYDFEAQNGTWAAMFHYPLPLDYNPYDPKTQGYNNTEGINHYLPNNPLGGEATTHINFNNGAPNTLDYEYEPIGFYTQRVFLRNQAVAGANRADINQADRRTLGSVEPPIDANGVDRFRTGYEGQVDNYAIYGRRTVILDVIPRPRDTDGNPNPLSFETGTDGFLPDDDRDGGATVFDPYPLHKGPDNKFQMSSDHGTRGKLVVVEVFWLPRKAPNGYIPAQDLNKIELKSFIPATTDSGAGRNTINQINRNDFLNISPPS